jgi:hypothetical protein
VVGGVACDGGGENRAGGTFATYSAAGWVRRNLQAAGFDVEKRPGFAGKRDMSIGRLNGQNPSRIWPDPDQIWFIRSAISAGSHSRILAASFSGLIGLER